MTPATSTAPKATPAEAMRENASRLALTLSVNGDLPMIARPHKLPDLPPGVRPRGGIASDNALGSMFGYLNTMGSGVCGLGFPGYPYLAELAQRSEYRAPIETIANELTREWIKLQGGEESKRDRLTELLVEFGVREKFRLAAIHDGTFGRAQIYIAVKGQDGPNRRMQPLKIDPATFKKGSLIGFQNIEPMWTTPYAYNTSDPTLPDFYRPDRWYIMGKETHADRLMTFISRPVPDMLKPSYNFGGLSLSQLTEPYVVRWLKGVDGVSRIIVSYSITYIATDMSSTLTDAGGADTLAQRARLFNLVRDNRGLAFINKDSEEFGQVNSPLTGLYELVAQLQEHMAAPTHIPLVFLTGITPSGLNASSDGEIKVFYNWIAGEQENLFDGHLRTVLQILQLHEYGEIDPEITFEWVPLDAPTDKELAEIRKADTDGAVALVGGAIISPDEAREALRNDPDSGYGHLKGDAPTPVLEEHALGEETAELTHGREEEKAQADHVRNLEVERAKAKNKPKPASDERPSALRAWWRKFTGASDAWNESDHPRGQGGKFGTASQSAPAVSATVQPMNTSEIEGSPEYKAAYVEHGLALREYDKAVKAYRAKEIGDAEYLAARKRKNEADDKFDAVWAAEQERQEAAALVPAVEPPSPQQSLL